MASSSCSRFFRAILAGRVLAAGHQVEHVSKLPEAPESQRRKQEREAHRAGEQEQRHLRAIGESGPDVLPDESRIHHHPHRDQRLAPGGTRGAAPFDRSRSFCWRAD